MTSLLVHIVSIGLRGAISPLETAIFLALLDTDKPRRNALSFVLSHTLIFVALAFVFFLISGQLSGSLPPYVRPIIDVALGVLLLSLAVVAWFRARGSDDQSPKWESALESVTPAKSFLLGVATLANNLTSLIFYLAGLRALTSANLAVVSEILVLALLIVLVELELWIPFAIYMAAPDRAGEVLDKGRQWLVRHNRALSMAVFGGLGVYLLTKGILSLKALGILSRIFSFMS